MGIICRKKIQTPLGEMLACAAEQEVGHAGGIWRKQKLLELEKAILF